MRSFAIPFIAIAAAAAVVVASVDKPLSSKPSPAKVLQATRVARGEYLVLIASCNDCHTPMKMGPKGPEPDMSRMLSGHPEGMKMPEPPKANGPWIASIGATNTAFAGPWGVSYTANLTPDQVTGLGIWTEETFIKAIRTGRHWGVSRPIQPPMPWMWIGKMSDEDLKSVYAYLRTIKPVHNQVPDAVIVQ
jgi:mono/diheme cytochrome c family protein